MFVSTEGWCASFTHTVAESAGWCKWMKKVELNAIVVQQRQHRLKPIYLNNNMKGNALSHIILKIK